MQDTPLQIHESPPAAAAICCRALCLVLALFQLIAVPFATAQANQTDTLLEEVVVTGKRGGPPLWRARRGANQLWIFGLVDPIPKSLDWDDESVSAILADSAVYLAPPDVSASVSNPFKAIGLLRRYGKLKRLPKPQRLSDVLPSATYARWVELATSLKLPTQRYEKLRPMFVAEAITERTWAKTKLETSERLQQRIHKLAKRAGARVVEHQVEIDINTAFKMLDEVTSSAELECLNTTMDALSGDLAAAKQRALAWAAGDARLLKSMAYPKVRAACSARLFTSPVAQAALKQARDLWLTSAQDALEQHNTSFAALPVAELLGDSGMLAILRQQGYDVRGL